jgi:hypothetical protein
MDLGRVFAGVPRVGVVDGCTHCYAKSDLELLGGDPALVPNGLVGSFAYEVTDHWSEAQYGLVWRGLAPRILGLLEASPDRRLLHGLRFARFSAWPDVEQTAVRDELRGMLARAVSGSEDPYRVEELVCAAAHVDQDLDAVAGLSRLADRRRCRRGCRRPGAALGRQPRPGWRADAVVAPGGPGRADP